MSEWKKVKFCSLFAIPSKNGLTKPSRVRGKGNKMINMGELFANGRIYDIPMDLVPLNESEKCKNQVLPDDLLFARQSLVLEGAGKCSIVMQTSEMTVFESHLIRIRLNKEDAYPLFYYYYFNSPYNPVKTIVSQCAQAGIRASDLSELQVVHPSLPTQHRIATILSRYDTLIENYQKQIKLLEEAAQRLYKEWFVELRFPGHENTKMVDGLPEGWERKKAIDFFEMSIGKTPPRAEKQWFTDGKEGVPWVSISDMKDVTYLLQTSEGLTKEACEKHNVRIVDEGTVLLSFKLTVGRVSIAGMNVCTNEAIAHFNKNGDDWREYTLLYLRNYNFDTLGNTSGISKAVNSTIVKNMSFLMPSGKVLDAFSNVAKPLFQKIKNLSFQIRLLTEARDRLLPRLMGGEMEV